MRSVKRDRLRKVLLEGNVLTNVQKRVARDYQCSVGGELDEVVVRLGFMTEEEVKAAVAKGIRLKVTEDQVARDLVAKVPAQLLRGYRVIPITRDGEVLLAAEQAGIEQIVLDEIWSLLGTQLPVAEAEPGSVTAVLDAIGDHQEAAETSGMPLPGISVQDLAALLVEKGLISEEDLRRQAEGARAPGPWSGP